MTTGRTIEKYKRVYVDGYDLSGHTRSIGPLSWSYDEGIDNPLSASVTGVWLGQASISPGTLNALYDNTALTGIRARLETSDAEREVLVAQGIQAVSAAGDPCFMSQCRQNSYLASPSDTPVALTVNFGSASGTSTALNGGKPWGILLNANTARTSANTANGIDQVVTTSSKGGWMMYHVTTSAGNGDIRATIKVQDCDTAGGTYADIVTSGVINTGSSGAAVPCSGAVALAPTATVRQFVRWQVVFSVVGGHECTSITFVLGFSRNLT